MCTEPTTAADARPHRRRGARRIGAVVAAVVVCASAFAATVGPADGRDREEEQVASVSGTDYGRGTTRSDNSPGTAGGLS